MQQRLTCERCSDSGCNERDDILGPEELQTYVFLGRLQATSPRVMFVYLS